MDLKLGHRAKDSVEVIDVQGEIDMYTAPRLQELLIGLVGNGSYQLVTAAEMGDSCYGRSGQRAGHRVRVGCGAAVWRTTATTATFVAVVRDNEEVVPVNVATWVLPSGVTVGR